MKTFKLAIVILCVLFASGTYGATESGEHCFSGSFYKEGDCLISLDVTEHTKYYSLNGMIDCDIKTNDDGISGVASGSGYLDGNIFIGSLVIPHEFGQVGIPFSEIAAYGMTFEVNLSDMTATFRKRTESSELCGQVFLPVCIEESAFVSTECP